MNGEGTMNELNELLTSSIELYRTLLDRTRELSAKLSVLSGAESITAYRELLDLQNACCAGDERLLPLLVLAKPNRESAPQLLERMRLIEEVVAENRRIMPLLLSRKAILAAELKQSREGQGSLSGYRSNGTVSGRLLSRSC
jgi:hypothetical protein